MWPGFKSLRRRYMWVEYVVGFPPCSERFFSGFWYTRRNSGPCGTQGEKELKMAAIWAPLFSLPTLVTTFQQNCHDYQLVVTPNDLFGLYCRDYPLNEPRPFLSGLFLVLTPPPSNNRQMFSGTPEGQKGDRETANPSLPFPWVPDQGAVYMEGGRSYRGRIILTLYVRFLAGSSNRGQFTWYQ